MPAMVILNPNADLGNGIKYLEPIQKALQPLEGVDFVLTQGTGHARKLAEEAIREGYDTLIAAGGDGTINEIVNGMMAAGAEDVKLGIIPLGTGNDFAHALGISKDVKTAVATIIEGRTRMADIALVEDDKGRRQYFANNMGAGFDANVVIRTAAITKLHGFPKYLAGVLTALARDFRPINLHVRYDDEEVADQKVFFLYMGIGPRGGGGFLLTPDATHDDDLVDSCTTSTLGRFKALTLINSARKGTHIHTPYVTMRKNKQIVIHSDDPMPVQVDGEIYAYLEDDIHHLMITSIPAALEVIV